MYANVLESWSKNNDFEKLRDDLMEVLFDPVFYDF